MRLWLLAALQVALGVPASAASEGVDLVALDFRYDPPELRAAPGAVVAFSNAGAQPHTATGRNGSFNVEAAPGKTVPFNAPMEPGTYAFTCAYHDQMKGNLTVDPAANSSPTTTTTARSPALGWIVVTAIAVGSVASRRLRS